MKSKPDLRPEEYVNESTVFAVALNHQNQREAWREAFEKAPYNTPPKTAVWFIKPHNTVIRAGDPIPFPQGKRC